MSEVRLDLTREDADAFEEALRGDSGMPGAFCLSVIVEAIRQQVPAPLEIPENLGAVVEDAEGVRYVRGPASSDARFPWLPVRMVEKRQAFSCEEIRQRAVRVLSEGVPS